VQAASPLGVPGEHLGDRCRLDLIASHAGRVTRSVRIHPVAIGSPACSLRRRPRRMRSAIRLRSYSATAPRICSRSWSCGSWLMGRSRNST
jgi:hypothetical protein